MTGAARRASAAGEHVLRWLQPTDEDGLAGVVRLVREVSAGEPYIGFGSGMTEDEAAGLAGRLAAGLASARARVLLAETAGGQAVGCVVVHRSATPNQAHIAELTTGVVHPDHRRSGLVGRALLVVAEQCARDGIDRLRLDVRDGIRAEGVWRALGFVEYGRLADYGRIGGLSYAGVYLIQRVDDLARRLRLGNDHVRSHAVRPGAVPDAGKAHVD